MVKINIGSKLKELRKQNGLTVTYVAKKLAEKNLPICNKTIYKWENGTINPDIKIFNALAEIYSTSIESFFTGNSKRQMLNPSEQIFINSFRKNELYRKIIFLLLKTLRGSK